MIVRVFNYNPSMMAHSTAPRVLMYYVLSKIEEDKKKLYWGNGYSFTPSIVKLHDVLSMNSRKTVMVVISPLQELKADLFLKKVYLTMKEYKTKTHKAGLRYVYGFHYNTNHPHAHVILDSYFPREVNINKRELALLKNIVTKVFNEPIGLDAYDFLGIEPKKPAEKEVEELKNTYNEENKSIMDMKDVVVRDEDLFGMEL